MPRGDCLGPLPVEIHDPDDLEAVLLVGRQVREIGDLAGADDRDGESVLVADADRNRLPDRGKEVRHWLALLYKSAWPQSFQMSRAWNSAVCWPARGAPRRTVTGLAEKLKGEPTVR